MFGSGILKGLGVTLKHVTVSYIDDVKRIPSRYAGGKKFIRQPMSEEGLFTIQYPEERRVLPERFRFVPMLIYDAETGKDRCTACGICSKVCPAQCIWIVRDQKPDGKPIPQAREFYVDIATCMGCGLCAEFCPFDAIKMNHDYELSTFKRYPDLVYSKEELSVPTTYYAQLYPEAWAEEEEQRRQKEDVKRKRAAAAAARAKAKAAEKAKKIAAVKTAAKQSSDDAQ